MQSGILLRILPDLGLVDGGERPGYPGIEGRSSAAANTVARIRGDAYNYSKA